MIQTWQLQEAKNKFGRVIENAVHSGPQIITNRSALSEWLEDELLVRFKDKVLPIDTAVMLVWGKLVADLEKQGKPMPAIDSLLAAIALQERLHLVTRNEDGFAHCGVAVCNPWEE